MHETLSPGLPPGHCLQEYTIGSVLGIGAFGITYQAHDNHLHQRVVIKEFFPSSLAARNPSTGTVGIKSPDCQTDFIWGKTRYVQEAQTLAQFNHPNIVRVYRYFEANSTSYMVMAFEEGRSLAQVLLDNDVDWDEAKIVAFVMPLLSGLAEVHKGGYLHRDIKPENILLRSKDDSPVLLDFGSARSMMSNYTMTAMVSPGYGPVEQYSSEAGDQGPWTDIYAMAAVLYRIVSKQAPVPALSRVKKDALIPAVFAGNGRYSKPFLKAIDLALSIDETRRPRNVATWLLMLMNEASPSPPVIESAIEVNPAGAPMAKMTQQVELPFDSEALSVSTQPPVTQAIRTTGSRGRLEMPTTRQRTAPNRSFSLRQLGVVVTALLVTMVLGLFAWSFTDEGFLRGAHFVYTTADRAHNTEWRYALVCPSYFNSEMTLADLNEISTAQDAPTQHTEKFQNAVIESAIQAKIVSLVSINGAAGIRSIQNWSKNGSFWCRDVLADFRAKKAKMNEELNVSRPRTARSGKPGTAKNGVK
jgi:serine/threonine protein kinase